MAEPNDATPVLPERRNLKALREAAAECRGCHLWRGATQMVFGEGLKRARLVFVGEQPGDKEAGETIKAPPAPKAPGPPPDIMEALKASLDEVRSGAGSR